LARLATAPGSRPVGSPQDMSQTASSASSPTTARQIRMLGASPTPRSPGALSGSGGGYPRGARPGPNVEEQRVRLEQLQREARELKAQEASLKWSMRREEEKQKRNEKKADAKDILDWRQQQKAVLRTHEAQLKKAQKHVENQESREFQEHKRSQKLAQKDEELQAMQEDYLSTKENSEWEVETKRIAMAEWPKPIIEENLEKYRLLAEYNVEEQQRQDLEVREARLAAEQSQMDHQLMQAQREKDLALQNLELVRAQKQAVVPAGRHLVARPK